jgi:hypothetical protein
MSGSVLAIMVMFIALIGIGSYRDGNDAGRPLHGQ